MLPSRERRFGRVKIGRSARHIGVLGFKGVKGILQLTFWGLQARGWRWTGARGAVLEYTKTLAAAAALAGDVSSLSTGQHCSTVQWEIENKTQSLPMSTSITYLLVL